MKLTAKNFKQEVKYSEIPVLVEFYAVWCGKCAMMEAAVNHIEKRYRGEWKVGRVDIEECPELASEYEIDIVPTFVIFLNGEIVGAMSGVIEEDLLEDRMFSCLDDSY